MTGRSYLNVSRYVHNMETTGLHCTDSAALVLARLVKLPAGPAKIQKPKFHISLIATIIGAMLGSWIGSYL